MVESLNADLMAELRSGGFKPIWKVVLKIAPPNFTENEDGSYTYFDTENEYAFVSGGVSRFGYQANVARVSPLSSQLDPLTRKMTPSGAEVVFFDDGAIRALCAEYNLRGQKLLLYLGTPHLAEDKFEQRFEGTITEPLPEADGSIRVVAEDWRAEDPSNTVSYVFNGVSPYEMLRSLVYETGAGGVNDATFAPPAARSHWFTAVTSEDAETWSPASGNKGVGTGAPLEFSIDELVFMLGGCLRSRFPTVATEWCEYDPNAAAAFVLTKDDVSSVVQRESGEYRLNHFFTSLNGRAIGTEAQSLNAYTLKERELTFQVFDGEALARSRNSRKTHRFDSRMFHNRARVIGAHNSGVWGWQYWNSTPIPDVVPFDAAATEFLLFAPTYAGITGAKTALVSGELALTAPVDATHLAYFMLVGSGRVEIVSCDLCSIVPPPTYSEFESEADVVGIFVDAPYPEYAAQYVTYRIKDRGLFGTQARDFYLAPADDPAYASECWAYDITAVVATCDRNIARFRDGIVILEVTAHPEHLDKEYGDAGAMVHDLVMHFELDGLTGTEVFEVIGKEERFDTDTPSVKLTLAWMRTGGVTPLPRQDVVELPVLNRQRVTAFERATSTLNERLRNWQRFIARGGGLG